MGVGLVSDVGSWSGPQRFLCSANLSDAISKGEWQLNDQFGCERQELQSLAVWDSLAETLAAPVSPEAGLFERFVYLLAVPPVAQ